MNEETVKVGTVTVTVSVSAALFRSRFVCKITDTVDDKLVYGFAGLPHDAVRIALGFAKDAEIDRIALVQAVSQMLYALGKQGE